jgi:glycosyltransferase involved in cell wall biosynthesis
MKLLIVTQKVDKQDDVLGFFERWILEFAKSAEKVTVICLEKAEHDLPDTVKVFSLGKEQGISRVKYIKNFYTYIWRERKNYDTVFVHMNPVYIVLAGLLWRMMGKKIALWYTHRHVNIKLRIAVLFAHRIFTSAKESFNLTSPKLYIVGHGIDTHEFAHKEKIAEPNKKVSIIHVGRITPIKNCDVLIRAAAILKDKLPVPCEVRFIGKPVYETDKAYKLTLDALIQEKKIEHIVTFVGSIPYKDITQTFYNADLSVNLTPTGGIDKAVLESFATGTPTFISNEAFSTFLGEYKDKLLVKYQDAEDLATKIIAYVNHHDSSMIKFLSLKVHTEYSVESLVRRILALLTV